MRNTVEDFKSRPLLLGNLPWGRVLAMLTNEEARLAERVLKSQTILRRFGIESQGIRDSV